MRVRRARVRGARVAWSRPQLDIELSADGKRWLDDFALKGPSPVAAPRSWDKSPVANGAHYFLYGKIDGSTPGVLQESGFGGRSNRRTASRSPADGVPRSLFSLQTVSLYVHECTVSPRLVAGVTFPNFIVDVQRGPS
eukprot:6916441-Prymnesium_polylepis.1